MYIPYEHEGERHFREIIEKWGNSIEELWGNWENIMNEYEERYGERFIVISGDEEYYMEKALKNRNH